MSRDLNSAPSIIPCWLGPYPIFSCLTCFLGCSSLTQPLSLAPRLFHAPFPISPAPATFSAFAFCSCNHAWLSSPSRLPGSLPTKSKPGALGMISQPVRSGLPLLSEELIFWNLRVHLEFQCGPFSESGSQWGSYDKSVTRGVL